jgi:hypothetical protein
MTEIKIPASTSRKVVMQRGERIASDFQPLIDLLQEVQAAEYETEQQQYEHFVNHVLKIVEAGPALEWARLANGAVTASQIQKLIPDDLWLLQDITPLFEEHLGSLRG